jgi:prevent-host-death family protein
MSRYSIAEAKTHLTSIVRDVEKRSPVELTRRGKPVAVIVSIDEYRRLTTPGGSFWDALEKFRAENDLAGLGLGPELFDDIRDDDPGRQVDL